MALETSGLNLPTRLLAYSLTRLLNASLAIPSARLKNRLQAETGQFFYFIPHGTHGLVPAGTAK